MGRAGRRVEGPQTLGERQKSPLGPVVLPEQSTAGPSCSERALTRGVATHAKPRGFASRPFLKGESQARLATSTSA
jgi:hypothetical protein